MANEITMVSSLTCTLNGMTVSGSGTKTQSIFESLDSMHHTLQDVGFSALEAVSLGDINKAKEHLVWLKNLGSTTIRIDPGVGSGYWFTLQAGETFGPVRIGASKDSVNPLQVQSVTSAGLVEVVAIEAGDPTAGA
jgi:hypothetical protein